MNSQLGTMSFGDVLDRGCKLLLARFGPLFLIGLIINVPIFLFMIVYALAFMSGGGGGGGGTFVNLAYMLLLLLLTIILNAIGTGAILKVIEQEYLGNKIGIDQAFNFAMGRAGPLILTSIVFGLVIMVGFILLIIPAFIFYCMYVLCVPACVLEGLGPIKAMDRSEKLTRGFKWRIFGLALVLALLTIAVSYIVGFTLGTALPPYRVSVEGMSASVTFNATNFIINNLLQQVLGIFITLYTNVCIVLIYFDLRVRKEGFALE